MKKNKILIFLLTTLFTFGLLTGCANKDDIDSAVEPALTQINLLQSTLSDMIIVDTSLENSINLLTSEVSTLENQLSAVETTINSLRSDLDDVKYELDTVKLSLEEDIRTLKSDIENLKAKDEDLSTKISTLTNTLTTELADIKIWANSTFVTIIDWNNFKSEITATITALTSRVDALEQSINSINTTITALKQQVDSNTDKITALESVINNLKNCIVGKHVLTIAYTWADDYSYCTAEQACAHCSYKVDEKVNSTKGANENTYIASFTNNIFSEQTIDLTNLTTMPSSEYQKALTYLFSKKPSDVTLTLPEDFSNFSYISDPIKNYGNYKYVNLTLKGVKKIGARAFISNKSLGAVHLPDVTEIGDKAFRETFFVKEFTAENVEKIGDEALSGCDITSIDFPKLTEIGLEVFAACDKLVTVNLPKLTTLTANVFANCSSLKKLDFPNVTQIQIYALHGTQLEEIKFGSCITAVYEKSFSGIKNGTENCSIIFAKGQKKFSDTPNRYWHQMLDDEITSSDTTFCGCTFKQITVSEG